MHTTAFQTESAHSPWESCLTADSEAVGLEGLRLCFSNERWETLMLLVQGKVFGIVRAFSRFPQNTERITKQIEAFYPFLKWEGLLFMFFKYLSAQEKK